MALIVGQTKWQSLYYFPGLGEFGEGGYVLCYGGGVGWIVAPSTTEVQRTWYDRDDAITTAEASAACGDWFIPTCAQFYNPAKVCQTYWNGTKPQQTTPFWSSTEASPTASFCMQFNPAFQSTMPKDSVRRVRAFRCITY